MSGHTKGPWELLMPNGQLSHPPRWSVCAENLTITICSGSNIGEEQRANAHLIKAAPDLLELVVAMQDDYQDILASGRPTGSSDLLMERAQALITKATQP